MSKLLIHPGKNTAAFENISADGEYLCILTGEETEVLSRYFQIDHAPAARNAAAHASRFESREGFDYISLLLPASFGRRQMGIYLTKNALIFVCDKKTGESLVTLFSDTEQMKPEKILYTFFYDLIRDDGGQLETIEQEIMQLEEELITAKRDNATKEIIYLRRRLLDLKKYYEQLFDIVQGIGENQNGLIAESGLRYFRILTGRVDRLFHSVMNLRDYVTQVREAYQAQVDIRLNRLMEIYTVITAIFLPLTLIVGWYGMNFDMPEYGWKYGYPAVIAFSAAVVTLCILWIKKKKML